LLIYGILRQPKVTISFSSSSRGKEVGRLFKRKGGGSSLQEEGRRVVSSRGREAGRPYRIAKMYL
jgi:hypothetical protein